MRLAYLDCFAGISGDMFLGALLGAGAPPDVLRDAAAALDLGATLQIETVDRSGISAFKVHVLEHGRLAEAAPGDGSNSRPQASPPDNERLPEQSGESRATHTMQPRTQHLHKAGHAHTHDVEAHPDHDGDNVSRALVRDSGPGASAAGGNRNAHAHTHGRSLTEICALIEAAPLDEAVRRFAIRTFHLLGTAEATVHNVPVEAIHFHEVGAVDAIVDIVAASAGIAHLAVDRWHCSPVNVGAGMVRCAHGLFPVPAPATAYLLRGVPSFSAYVEQELVTPTGAALLRALEPRFGSQPAMETSAIGYGAGTRNPPDFPNVLRLSLGAQSIPTDGSRPERATGSLPATAGHATDASLLPQAPPRTTETITVLETALDDLSPQITAYVAEQALALGALDVMLTPVVMKKGRPGTLLTVLCGPEQSAELEALLLRETSTLGVRRREEQRACLARRHVTVETAYGPIRVKVGTDAGAERNAAPEFEDCRSAAQAHHVPLKQVQQAALAAHRGQADR